MVSMEEQGIKESETITVNHARVSLSLISVPLDSGDKAFIVVRLHMQCLQGSGKLNSCKYIIRSYTLKELASAD